MCDYYYAIALKSRGTWIMNLIEKGIRYIARRCVYGPKSSSKLYIQHLKSIGVQIGEGTIFFNPMTVTIAEGEPFMLTIGKNCQITGGYQL